MAGLLSRYFGFRERATDLATEMRAGFTTFMVMAYIIFVNPIILGFTGVPGLDGRGLPFAATLTVTCLTAGLLSIAMGLASNYPFALATGMGLNAVVAFELVASRGLTWPQAMTVVFLEGLVITVLVLTRFREAVMDAVPIALKRAISVGIGLFILYILRTIHDGNDLARGTNRFTHPYTLDNILEVALRRIPITPDLEAKLVVRHRTSFAACLDPGMSDVSAASDLLKPYDARAMRCYPVSSRINHLVK
jgi:hypothetical protein